MFHFSFPLSKRTIMHVVMHIPFFFTFMVCVHLMLSHPLSAEPLNQVTSVTAQNDADLNTIRISTSAPPTYTAYELFNPQRVVVDIAEATLTDSFTPQLPEESGISFKSQKINDIDPPLIRLEFTLPKAETFTDTAQGNDIILSFVSNPKEKASPSVMVSDVQIQTEPKRTIVQILANTSLNDYTSDVLKGKKGKPARMFIDINNVTGDTLLKKHEVGTSLARIRIAQRGSGLRFVFDSSTDILFPYSITPDKKGLKITINEEEQSDNISALISQNSDIDNKLPDVDPLQEENARTTAENKIQDSFNFSGYTKERITVDFYKIDLHNVFRLFREVSGINIVVDEGVSGSLTLALDDVPWDFALDIILNLKKLGKEERFNTLVIYPKGKHFNWPEQAGNNVSVEPDIEVTQKEALIIRQQKSLPKEIIEAKQTIIKAKEAEKQENFELAVRMYEQAFAKWPDNARLANKIASIYLVHLRQNTKASYYAKKSLKADLEYTPAALNAAIALANMRESAEALEYFNQSISGEKPSSQALLSYAVFTEEQKRYQDTLKLLEQHDLLYGKDLGSMIATARVYDKMDKHEIATEKYQAILLSGLRVPPDLKKYITSRITSK